MRCFDLVRPLNGTKHPAAQKLQNRNLSNCFISALQKLSDNEKTDLIRFIHTANNRMSFFRLLSEQSVTTF